MNWDGKPLYNYLDSDPHNIYDDFHLQSLYQNGSWHRPGGPGFQTLGASHLPEVLQQNLVWPQDHEGHC